jgi:hypothetical protein
MAMPKIITKVLHTFSRSVVKQVNCFNSDLIMFLRCQSRSVTQTGGLLININMPII